MRDRIELTTTSDALEFVSIISKLDGRIYLEDGLGQYKVSACSFLAAICTMEWDDVYVVSENNIYKDIAKFIK
ncbi:MAG: hypothetical protein PUF04_09760 [bacterium]|nr:hypothetical protein [bacterium]